MIFFTLSSEASNLTFSRTHLHYDVSTQDLQVGIDDNIEGWVNMDILMQAAGQFCWKYVDSQGNDTIATEIWGGGYTSTAVVVER